MMTLRLFQKSLAGALTALMLFSASHVSAQETQRVAAVVNDDIISLHDLEQRMRLALASSNLPDNMENRSRIAQQVLRGLIDEHLKTQEADRLKIAVAPAEIANGIATIERQNNMPKGSFEPYLKERGIDADTIHQQIRAELAWIRVVRHELIPDVHIGEEEIDARLAALKSNLGKPEYLVGEIFLSVEDLRHEAEVHNLADRLIEQMHQGAPFSALARQFSQTGAAGGDLGWVSEGMLDASLMGPLSKMDKGNITPPIRTIDGYHILLLRDRRIAGQNENAEALYDILTVQMPLLPSSTAAERAEELKRFKDATASGKNCDDLESQIKQKMPSAEYNRATKVKESEIPPNIAGLINGLPQGQFSEPLEESGIRRLFAVCRRVEAKGGLPSRDDVRARLEDEQIDIMARRYLRDLRRAAFVEIRV